MSLISKILRDKNNPKAHLLNNPNLLKQIGVTEEMVNVDKLKELRV